MSSSEQCSTTTCKTQQSANATSQQNLHSAGDCVEELKHCPNVSPDDIADIPFLNRLVVPSAKCKLFWTNSDQALDAVFEKECPNFDHLPPAAALQQLERAVHFFFFFPSAPNSSQAIWPRKPEMNAPRLLYVHPTPFIFSGTSGNGLAAKSFAFKSVAAVVSDIPLHWVCLTRCTEC